MVTPVCNSSQYYTYYKTAAANREDSKKFMKHTIIIYGKKGGVITSLVGRFYKILKHG